MDTSKSPFNDPESPGKSESPTSDPSSATAIFGTVSAKLASPQGDDLLRSLMGAQGTPSFAAQPEKPSSPDASQTQPWTPVVPPVAVTPAASSGGTGEFTEIFQALQKQDLPPAQPPLNPPAPNQTPAPQASAKAPNDLASVFTQVIVEKTAFVSPPPASKPGEFTQLLQTLSNSAEQSEPQTPAPLPAAAAPGAFTQMFNTVSAKPSEPAQPAVFSGSEHPPAAPLNSETGAPGEFTRVFQSAPSRPPIPPAGPPQPAAGPGAFTQMFSAKPIESTPADDPLKSLKPEPAPAVNPFQIPATPARPNEAIPAAQGGFTQLLQALNKEEPSRPAEPIIAPPPLQPAPSTPGVGGFTQLLQTLSAESTPKEAPPVPFAPPAQSAPAPPSGSSGPGEFTRIISGSQLRDLQSQSANPGPAAGPAPQAARPPAPPLQFPQAPAFPPAPPMPRMHAAQAPSTPASAMPHFQPPAFQFPPAPAAPAPPPPATSKLQQYLPLILILNIFVLLVIVLILIFVLRHH